jgi:hypothetical protein
MRDDDIYKWVGILFFVALVVWALASGATTGLEGPESPVR